MQAKKHIKISRSSGKCGMGCSRRSWPESFTLNDFFGCHWMLVLLLITQLNAPTSSTQPVRQRRKKQRRKSSISKDQWPHKLQFTNTTIGSQGENLWLSIQPWRLIDLISRFRNQLITKKSITRKLERFEDYFENRNQNGISEYEYRKSVRMRRLVGGRQRLTSS
jgi:hypothetical protein